MFTIVFLSLHSETHIRRLVSSIDTKFPIIIIENSQNYELKNRTGTYSFCQTAVNP